MKNKSGISLVELVIVMIIMILLVGFAIFNGSKSIQQSEATELYAEMTSMKNAVSGIMIQKELEDGGDDWIKAGVHYDVVGENGWYLVYGIDEAGYEASNVRKNLDMDTIKRSYLVNYETGEVMLATPAVVLGSSVRSYESVRALVESDKI